jgi:hypothetical protein
LVFVLSGFSHQFIEEDHFTRGSDEMLTKFRATFWFLAIKEVGVVANFAELYQDVFVVGHGIAFFDARLFKEVSVNTFL